MDGLRKLCDIVAGGEGGDAAVRRSGGQLANLFCPAIPCREHARARGQARLVGDDKAAFVKLYQITVHVVFGHLANRDEQAVDRDFRGLPGHGVAQCDGGKRRFAGKVSDRFIEQLLDIADRLHFLDNRLFRAKAGAAVNQINFFADVGKINGALQCSVAAADNRRNFIAEKRAVTNRAIRHPAAGVGGFSVDA